MREYAKQYSHRAIDELAKIGFSTKASVSARVSALNALLDRGHGKPSQTVELESTTPLASVTVNIPGLGTM